MPGATGRIAPTHYANWLRVKLGLMSGNKPRTLVFSAKRDGVHGMVAGSTGSGKSELLISLISRDGGDLRPDGAQFCAGGLQGRRRVQRVRGAAALCGYHHQPAAMA